MKKHLLAGLAVIVFVAGASGNVWADTISYTEEYNPTDVLLNAKGQGQDRIIEWIFDLRDNAGWETPGQVFTNGIIKFDVRDDKGAGDGSEKGLLTYEGQKKAKKATKSDINSAYWKNNFIVDSSAFGDGFVKVTLTATTGDFWFRSALLTVTSNYTPELSPLVSSFRQPELPLQEVTTVRLQLLCLNQPPCSSSEQA